jgi:glycolate oxidase FAD binding subunit
MNTVLEPTSFQELAEAVRATPRLIPVGAGTKPRLAGSNAARLCVAGVRGISEYDPSEFTFTAAAGTPLAEIVDALAQRGQYLPFDPLLVEAGATLGGTVASGLSGPGRFRYGGLRDFIIGVRFVDGLGRLLRMGGKVVKNAAGFDLPKFFVGSLGRFGVLAELTFKVFPRPPATLTLRLTARTLADAVQLMADAGNSRFEFDALDVAPGELGVLARLCVPPTALEAIAREVIARWPGEVVAKDAAERLWRGLRELRWTKPDGPLVKIAVPWSGALALGHAVRAIPGAQFHLTAGGNLAYASLSADHQTAELDAWLQKASLAGLTVRGDGPLWLGAKPRPAITAAVKQALDPENRFPSLDD